jgi:hypothetical protein
MMSCALTAIIQVVLPEIATQQPSRRQDPSLLQILKQKDELPFHPPTICSNCNVYYYYYYLFDCNWVLARWQ